MRRIKLSILALSLCAFVDTVAVSAQPSFTQQQYAEDFDYLWQSIADNYAYFDQKQTDWNKVKEIYRPQVSEIKTRSDFIALLENVLEELYDFHTHLNTNTASSPRLVPSGADMWAEWIQGKAVITEVRPMSAAEKVGVRVGMQVTSINGVAVDEAVRRRLGKSLRGSDQAARNWALRILLTGRHNERRSIEVISHGERRVLSIDDQTPDAAAAAAKPLLDYRRVGEEIGYIRINNSLGDTELIKQFDDALERLRDTKGLILDLRDTPSGGNTTVARGIMGRFISRDMPYQKHSIPAEEREYEIKRSWIELVSPRGFTYRAPVVVLVNHWTGSMGEGTAIGMDGMKRATVVGTEMARLMGATSGIKLPNTGIGVTFPTEKLFHVNGTPRENFVPPVYVNLLSRESGDKEDVIFQIGLRTLRSHRHVSLDRLQFPASVSQVPSNLYAQPPKVKN